MACRSRVDHDFKVNGKYKRMGRFNGGVVTLNPVQLALETLNIKTKEGRIEAFFKALETEAYPIMKESLIARFDFVKELKAKE
ncbi:MAG: anaerobic ribonucleoside-triphosphate reductase, partial [Cetobacterium sp.]